MLLKMWCSRILQSMSGCYYWSLSNIYLLLWLGCQFSLGAQDAGRAWIMQHKEIFFFQVEAEVVKNSKQNDYVDGLCTKDDTQSQLLYKGGIWVCLHFPTCDCKFDLELKFVIVLLEPTTFQVWGTHKLGREFHKKLFRLKNEQNCESLYSCYLLELYGDLTQTIYLSTHYKI
jgi:hypothetical protein